MRRRLPPLLHFLQYVQHVTRAPPLPATPTPAGIDYLTSTKVTAVDVAAKQLTTAGGEAITFDKLVVATGARVRQGKGVGCLGWEHGCGLGMAGLS